ncbi:hypothetical protein BLNAU_23514 [Blattamonas nauphoetae]|uniref:Uncharacterized protein n=1 Tax=Blattamonas nauphoetae TaxID=2049346 RepID=A0ABQ9WQF6_9EUKA|nr:hypothetical protein BLNAU_23514 [Blattamonas nauphoetae]
MIQSMIQRKVMEPWLQTLCPNHNGNGFSLILWKDRQSYKTSFVSLPIQLSITDDDENTSLIGEFQLFEFHRLIFETRYSLFKQFNLQFPGLISKTFFYNHTTTLSQPRNRTDLCDLCETAETIQFDDRKGTENPEQLAEDENYLKNGTITSTNTIHNEGYTTNTKRHFKTNKLSSLRTTSRIYFFLFKKAAESFIFPATSSHCVCANNNKQSFDVICALRTVFWHPSMKDINSVQFWADGGSNFKCSETIHALTVLFPRRRLEQAGTQLTVVVNYFETAHGKMRWTALWGAVSDAETKHPQNGTLFVLRFTQLFPSEHSKTRRTKPEHLRHHYVLEYDRAQEFIDPCNLTIKGIKASLKFEVINGLLYTSQTSASFEPKTVSLWSKRNDTSQTRLQDTSISTVKTQVSSGFAESVAHEIESIEGKLPHVYSRSVLSKIEVN